MHHECTLKTFCKPSADALAELAQAEGYEVSTQTRSICGMQNYQVTFKAPQDVIDRITEEAKALSWQRIRGEAQCLSY